MESKPRERVLLVRHGDGYVELFGGKHIDVHVANVPYLDLTVPETDSIEARAERSRYEIMALDYMEACLPRAYRDLYWPGNLRATDTHKKLRPSDIADREHHLACLKALDGIQDQLTRNEPSNARPLVSTSTDSAEGTFSWTV